MLKEVHPKLPMRNKQVTKDFYINKLGFKLVGTADYHGYLMIVRDHVELHFFEFKDLVPKKNYGQVYFRTENIDQFYQSLLDNNTPIHPSGPLELKPWNQKEFAVLDPDSNLLTFGESI